MTFLLTLVVVCLVVVLIKTRSRVDELSDRVRRLELGVPPVLESAPARQPESSQAEAAPVLLAAPIERAEQALPRLPEIPAGPSLADRIRALLSNQEWELLVGGNLLNKLGALILVIGIALFLGYSLGHVTPAGRAAIAVAISVAALLAGVRLQGKGRYTTFARGLIGVGWAALYATSYAIYAVPEARVISNPFLGSLVVVSVAAAMIWHSLRYRSQGVTAVAFFAAFAAMAVTPSSPFAVVGLLPLAASLLYLAWRFKWHAMALFGLAATYLTCISRGSSNAPLYATQTLFLAYWSLFEAFDLLRVKRRLVAGGQELLFPVNALCFLGLSYLAWSAHAPGSLWMAAGFGAALFLASSLIRALMRPPSTFPEGAGLSQKFRAGSYESAFLVSAVLAGLSIVGRVAGVWAAVGLAVEAEIVYLAGVRLQSSFLRWIGSRAFALSILKTLSGPGASGSSPLPGGRIIWNWEPPLLFHAFLFYVNRAVSSSAAMSSFAAAIVAAVLIVELPIATLGLALILFGLLLLELGLRKPLPEFRAQGATLLIAGVVAIAIGLVHRGDWSAHAVGLAVIYATAVRTRWITTVERKEREWIALAASISSAILSIFLAWRLTPEPYLGAAFWVVAILALELGSKGLPSQLRLCFAPLAILACATLALHLPTAGKFPPTPVWIEYDAMCLATLAASIRLTLRPAGDSLDWEPTLLRDAMLALSGAAALVLSWMLIPDPFVAVVWTAIALALLAIGVRTGILQALLQSYGIAGFAFAWALWHDVNPPRLWIAAIVIGAFYTAQWFSKRSEARIQGWVSPYFSVLGTLLLAALLYGQASGGLLTVSWGVAGLLLLGIGFALRERVLRLQGLGLLLTCILKLFLYDLRNLETLYRILSFVVLGLILLGVSWIYSRFRESVLRLL